MTKSELSKRAASRLRDKWAKFVKKGRKKGYTTMAIYTAYQAPICIQLRVLAQL